MEEDDFERSEITIESLSATLVYETPYGALDVTQSSYGVEFRHGPVVMSYEHDRGQAAVDIHWLSVLDTGISLRDAVRQFQRIVGHWSQMPKVSVFKDGLVPPIDIEAVMRAAYPSLIQSMRTIAEEVHGHAQAEAREQAKLALLRSLPDGTPLLEEGVVADLKPGSPDEDTNCIALMRLRNGSGQLSLERWDNGGLEEIFENDPVVVISGPHAATSENARKLIGDLRLPRLDHVLFCEDEDLDTEAAYQADQIIRQASQAVPVKAQPEISVPTLEEWLSVIRAPAYSGQ